MATLESAFEKIKGLVSDFKKNEQYYLSSKYSEAEVREDYINKFFVALGWDVRHKIQKNPYEQEVKVEKGVKVGRAQKRADYAFHLAPNFRDPVFFVEAKKPARSLSNPDDYFQAIRYGWNANTPIVILTDFEEFHIIDSRFKPDIDTALSKKLQYFHYSEYADKDIFAEIYYLISREAVGNNSIEKYAESLPKPRGKAVQRQLFPGGFQSIDESFLEETDEIRITLARAFKKANLSLDGYELTEATQRTIDRLVFIRFLEDKLIEQEHYISEFGESSDAWDDFVALSKRLDAKYNGVVFKHHFIDDPGFNKPKDIFSKICEDISHLNSPYDFDKIPIHILGSIYERFLGKVVHATPKRVSIEEKPEVKKAGGVYYTPQYIVRYIVSNTVGKLLEGKTPLQISRLRFADISCGSGSFLITVLETLLDYHNNWYQNNPTKAKSDGCFHQDGKWILSLQQKKNILLNNIYGVDIDSQAVEVTQLSLSLKLLEDETTATANEMQVLFHEQILPDLTKNIVCGNSLIGMDVIFSNLFTGDEERKLNPMDFENAFPEIISKGGFDAIVGNPPYDVLEKERKMDFSPHTALRQYVKLNSKYSPALGGKLNLFRFFVVRMINLTMLKGKFGFIIPLSILADQSCASSRAFLFDSSKDIIADCFPQKDNSNKRVFKDAKLSTMVITGSHSVSKIKDYEKSMTVRTYPWNKFNDEHKEAKILLNELKLIDSDNLPVPLIDNADWELLTKIYKTKDVVTLSNVSDFVIRRGEINQTIFRKFISDNPKHVRLLKGVEIGQYKVNKKLSQGKKEYFIESEYLKVNKEKPFAYGERIATQRITGVDEQLRIVATIIKPVAYFADSTNSIHKESNSPYHLYYLIALLNSRLFQWRFKLTSTNNNVGTNELEALPFRIVNFKIKSEKENHDKIVQMVEQIIEAKKKLTTAKMDKDINYYERKCSNIDREINKEVYKLYGLSKDEIEIINSE